jgi:trigger factor
MDFTIEPLAPCRKKIGVTIPRERIRAEYDKQYGEINRQLALPGFRKGHTPRKLLEKRFGGALDGEVKTALVKAAIEELVRDRKVEPLSPPSIDVDALAVDPTRPLTFEFELATRPEFTTPTWKGLEMLVTPVTVEDAEVAEAVEGLRRRGARLESQEGAVIADGDVLVLDWSASAGGQVVSEDQGAYHPFGRGALAGLPAEALETALRGQKAGATASAEVTAADDDLREELRGKTVTLTATVREVKRYVLPEVDAAFLSKHDYDDADEMRADLKRQIQRGKTRERDQAAEEQLLDQVVASAQLELPDDLLAQELDAWEQRRIHELTEGGTEHAEAAKQAAAGRPEARTQIAQELKRFFVLDRIAREESLVVADQEVAQAISEIAQAYGRPVEEVIEVYRQGGRLEELRSQLRHRKVREAVRRAAHVVERAGGEQAGGERA